MASVHQTDATVHQPTAEDVGRLSSSLFLSLLLFMVYMAFLHIPTLILFVTVLISWSNAY